MVTPNNPQEHLQDVIRQVYNREIREWFNDAEDTIYTARGSLRVACTHQDNDSFLMTLVRFLVFTDLRSRGINSIPTEIDRSPQVLRKLRPKITLYFLEDASDVETGYAPVAGEIGFRLMEQTMETLSEPEAKRLANKIKLAFGGSGGYTWKKGKLMASYSDWDQGYQLQLLCRDQAEARRVIEQALDVQGHTPDWKNLNFSQNAEPSTAFPTVPPTEQILGRTRRLPRRRPIATVRFQYARLDVMGLPNPVILYDRSGVFPSALVR